MRITQDYYLIVDVEATCANDNSIPRQRMEIIEIGAVILNSKTLQLESEYQSFIKPILHPLLTEFCKSLTSISQQDVEVAPLFPDALKEFQSWFYPFGSYIFCSWGDYDRNQFKQDCTLHGVGYPFPGGHLNLKKAFSVATGSKKKFGMTGALEKLGIELEGVHHRGIDDAKNIARIVRAILSS
ncbi:MAG: 3'-5' exonuclease [Prochloraceae cyanobacterium]|nr:3'-5' exonuclease [Prochloraceae cyanobacterium]